MSDTGLVVIYELGLYGTSPEIKARLRELLEAEEEITEYITAGMDYDKAREDAQ